MKVIAVILVLAPFGAASAEVGQMGHARATSPSGKIAIDLRITEFEIKDERGDLIASGKIGFQSHHYQLAVTDDGRRFAVTDPFYGVRIYDQAGELQTEIRGAALRGEVGAMDVQQWACEPICGSLVDDMLLRRSGDQITILVGLNAEADIDLVTGEVTRLELLPEPRYDLGSPCKEHVLMQSVNWGTVGMASLPKPWKRFILVGGLLGVLEFALWLLYSRRRIPVPMC